MGHDFLGPQKLSCNSVPAHVPQRGEILRIGRIDREVPDDAFQHPSRTGAAGARLSGLWTCFTPYGNHLTVCDAGKNFPDRHTKRLHVAKAPCDGHGFNSKATATINNERFPAASLPRRERKTAGAFDRQASPTQQGVLLRSGRITLAVQVEMPSNKHRLSFARVHLSHCLNRPTAICRGRSDREQGPDGHSVREETRWRPKERRHP